MRFECAPRELLCYQVVIQDCLSLAHAHAVKVGEIYSAGNIKEKRSATYHGLLLMHDSKIYYYFKLTTRVIVEKR